MQLIEVIKNLLKYSFIIKSELIDFKDLTEKEKEIIGSEIVFEEIKEFINL